MAKRRSKSKKKRNNKIPGLSEKILDILRSNANQSINYKQIAAKLDVNDANSRNQIIKELAKLSKGKQIIQAESGKFQINERVNYFTGTLDMTTRKDGYVVVEDQEQDIYVPGNNLNRALDGDEVKVYVYRSRRGRKPEGEVVEILKDYSNIELIWASPRELYNVIQANDIGCHIITATNNILKKLPTLGKDLDQFSLETVQMFYDDAKNAGYTL